MKPSQFEYHAPETLAGAVGLLSDLGEEAKVLAGGQSLVPMLNLRLARPAHLIDIGRIGSLGGVSQYAGGLCIGALTTHREIERSQTIREKFPILSEAARWIAHPPIRARGTVGGSLAHADPAAELPAVMRLLDAELVAFGSRGERTISVHDFFLSFLTSTLKPDEILTEIRLPALPEGTRWAFREVSRRHGDFAIAGVAALLRCEGDAVQDLSIALFGLGPTPIRATEAEEFSVGKPCGLELWRELATRATDSLQPVDDLHGTAAYRRHVAGTLVERALTALVAEEN